MDGVVRHRDRLGRLRVQHHEGSRSPSPHRNTLIYRLDKIARVLRLSLDESPCTSPASSMNSVGEVALQPPVPVTEQGAYADRHDRRQRT